MNLRPNLKIAEIGAGNGSLALFLSQTVGPDGLVVATEFDGKLIDKISKKAQRNNAANLKAVFAKSNDPNLPGIQFDLILMKKVYHHFTHAQEQNMSFYSHLKPGGKLAIIDFEPKWYLKLSTPAGVPKKYGGHGIFKKILVAEVESAGFRLENLINNFSGGMFCAIFRK